MVLVALAVATGLVPSRAADARAAGGPSGAVAKGSSILLVDSGGLGPGAEVAASLERVFESTGVLADTRWMHHRAFVPSQDPSALVRSAGAGLRAVVLVLGGLDWLPGVDPVRPAGPVGRRVDRELDPAEVVEEIARWRVAAERAGARLVLATAPLGIAARTEVPEVLEIEELVRAAGCDLDLARHFRQREDREEFVHGFDDLNRLGREALVRFVYAEVVTRPGLLPAADAAEDAARREARALLAVLAGDEERLGEAVTAALRGEAPTGAHAVRRAALAQLTEAPARVAARWAALPVTDGARPQPGQLFGRLLAGHDDGLHELDDPVEDLLVRWLRALQVGADAGRSATDRSGALLVARARLDELKQLAPERLETWIAQQVVAGLEDPPRRVRTEALSALGPLDEERLSPALAARALDAGPAGLAWIPALLAAAVPERGMTPTGPGLHQALRRLRLVGPGAGLRRLRLVGERGDVPQAWIELLAEGGP